MGVAHGGGGSHPQTRLVLSLPPPSRAGPHLDAFLPGRLHLSSCRERRSELGGGSPKPPRALPVPPRTHGSGSWLRLPRHKRFLAPCSDVTSGAAKGTPKMAATSHAQNGAARVNSTPKMAATVRRSLPVPHPRWRPPVRPPCRIQDGVPQCSQRATPNMASPSVASVPHPKWRPRRGFHPATPKMAASPTPPPHQERPGLPLPRVHFFIPFFFLFFF